MEVSPASTWRTPTVRWMGGWPSISHPWPRQTTMAWPRRAHVEALTWSAWSADNRTGHLPQETQPYGVNDHLSPGTSCSPTSARKTWQPHFRLRLGAPHQSHSKGIARRNMKMRKCTQAGVLAKSGVLTEKDSISQNHEMLKCTNN